MLVKAIAKGLDSLWNLTRMHFALYDDKQQLLASSPTGDKLLSLLKVKRILQAPYNTFRDRQLKLAVIRQDPFIIQGFTGQYHAFIPLHNDGTTMLPWRKYFIHPWPISRDFASAITGGMAPKPPTSLFKCCQNTPGNPFG